MKGRSANFIQENGVVCLFLCVLHFTLLEKKEQPPSGIEIMPII
jgi:hypothetical protein